ncbi:MAG: SAM-dependent methyltransferase, partial [Sinorhizobium fredii]|nr:SAM-dependent methyltransferase [Sinorhizobium fredii]
MEIIFDQSLVEAHRRRALQGGGANATFLLDIVAQELADRVAVVERHFDKAMELHGYTGATAARLAETGKVGSIERVETDEG